MRISDAAIPRRWRIPCEYVATRSFARERKFHARECVVDARACVTPVVRSEKLEVLAAAQVPVEMRRLDKAGDAAERLRELRLRIAAEQAHGPCIRTNESEQDP